MQKHFWKVINAVNNGTILIEVVKKFALELFLFLLLVRELVRLLR